MPRTRTIYQSESLFVGPTPATGAHFSGIIGYGGADTNPINYDVSATPAIQLTGTNRVNELYRVQSANYSFNIPRTEIMQYNQLAAIDRVILEQPTVSLDFSWIQNNVYNERILGLTLVSPGKVFSCISGIANKETDEKNYFILTTPQGTDAQGYNNKETAAIVWGIGNGYITSYRAEGSVGNFPTASVTVDALNMKVDVGVGATGYLPAVDSNGNLSNRYIYMLPTGKQSYNGNTINNAYASISALRPGDITLSLGTADIGPTFSTMNVQNYTLSLDIGREDQRKLGAKYPISKEITYPLRATLSVTADISDMTSGTLSQLTLNDPNRSYEPIISIASPVSTVLTGVVWYQLKGAELDGMEITSSIGPNKSATFNFSSSVGSPGSSNGLFISGIGYDYTLT